MQSDLRSFTDYDATRRNIFDGVKGAVASRFPMENARYQIELSDLTYDRDSPYTLTEQKQALLENRSLSYNLRGRLRMIDRETGQVVDETGPTTTIARVPYMTPRGTFINKGNEYTVANQSRLLPGVYTRRKQSGEYEAHFNALPGQGRSFHTVLQPDTGVFNLMIGQAKIPLYPVLNAIGVEDETLEKAWGTDLLKANQEKTSKDAVRKAYERLSNKSADGKTEKELVESIRDTLMATRLDPSVTKSTLGRFLQEKKADVPMRGMLKVEDSRKPWGYLTVPQGLLDSVYYALRDSDDNLGFGPTPDKAHITVFKNEEAKELKRIYGKDWPSICGSGRKFIYYMDRVKKVNPPSWDGIDQVWFIEVRSEALEKFRESLGLPPRPLNTVTGVPEHFHITVGVKPTKKASDDLNDMFEDEEDEFTEGAEVLGNVQLFTKEANITNIMLEGPDFEAVTPNTLLRATQKLLNINRGVETVDNRDTLAYQKFMGPEDFFTERIAKDAGGVLRNSLFKATNRGNLNAFRGGVFDPHINSVLITSGLGSPIEEINPLEIVDQNLKITRLGEGGISTQAVPMESRNLNPSHLGFIDPVRSPESGNTGIDLRMAYGTMKGKDGQVYSNLRDMSTNKIRPVSAREASNSVLVFPGEMSRAEQNDGIVRAMVDGNIEFVSVEDADFEIPNPETMFNLHSNLVPGVSGIKGGRLLMGSKYFNQALPLKHGEAPLVQSEHPDGGSFYSTLGKFMGAVSARDDLGPGTVMDITDEAIIVKHGDEEVEYPTYNHFPMNRKCIHGDTRLSILKPSTRGIVDLKVSEYEWEPGDKILSVDKYTGVVGWRDITGFKEIKNDKELYAVTTNRGHHIVVTEDHSLVTLTDDKLTKLYPKDVVVGHTLIPIPREYNLPYPSELEQDVVPLPQEMLDLLEGELPVGIVGSFRDKGYMPTEYAQDTALARWCTDLQWARVEGVERAPESEYVYDLSTNDSTFLANGVFVHNTYIHSTPTVLRGDTVKPGQLIARSNYIDEDGNISVGKNLRVAYLPWGDNEIGGVNFEDGVVISESAAKALTSEHLYQKGYDKQDKFVSNKDKFISLFPGEFNQQQLDKIDPETGVAKLGAIVNPGDPVILGVGEDSSTQYGLLQRSKPSFYNRAEIWDHEAPGLVTDVTSSKGGYQLSIKSYDQMKVGDKLCYDQDTEILTLEGWKNVSEVSLTDIVATLNPDTDKFEWGRPTHLHEYDHNGDMYYLNNKHVNMLVTLNHNLWVSQDGENYKAVPAEEVYNSKETWYFKKDCGGRGSNYEPEYTTLYHSTFDAPGGKVVVPTEVWIKFLGYYVSQGYVENPEKGDYRVMIDHYGYSKSWNDVKLVLDAMGLPYVASRELSNFCIHSEGLYNLVEGLKDVENRAIPPSFTQFMGDRHLKLLVDTMMVRDGRKAKTREYRVRSLELAEHFQTMCTMLGWSTTLKQVAREPGYLQTHLEHIITIDRRRVRPEHNKLKNKINFLNQEKIVQYTGKVYCVTVPNHILFVRRKGKTHWSCNSGRYGDKTIVSAIVPDEKMPRDANERAFDVILNPLGITTRGNPSQAIEAALGKIAEKTGKPYVIPGFTEGSMVEFAMDQLKKHNISDTEDIFDPIKGKNIPGVFTGNRFLLKLHHQGESKLSARDSGAYSMDEAPAKGGFSGAKRLGLADINALISHGSLEVLRDARLVRGQKNDEYWRALKSGQPIPPVEVPFVWDKFVNTLKASGVDVTRKGDNLNIYAMTSDDIDKLSYSEVTTGDTIDFRTGKEVKGGLFDPSVFGSNLSRFGYMKLDEPIVNPVMEDVVRNLLGLTKNKFNDVVAGKENIGDHTGMKAIRSALEGINIDQELKNAGHIVRTKTGQARSNAVKKMGFLSGMKNKGVRPEDFIWDKIPVLPPQFRPITDTGEMQLISDANYLYKDVFDQNKNIQQMRKLFGDESLGEDRLNLYNSVKSLVGLQRSSHPKLEEKNVKGLLKQVFGDSPKLGMLQRKVLSTTLDSVGNAVITPDPNLDMDHVGIPEEMAWDIFKPYALRHLTMSGMKPIDAVQHMEERTSVARSSLMKAMEEKPVLITRAPVLHKYGIMASKPVLVPGNTLRISPSIVEGFNADFNGDCTISTVIVGISNSDLSELDKDPRYSTLVADIKNFGLKELEMSAKFNVNLGMVKDHTFLPVHLEDFPRDRFLEKKNHIEYYSVPEGIKVVSMEESTNKLILTEAKYWSIHKDVEIEIVTLSSGKQLVTDDDVRAIYGIDKETLEWTRTTPTEAKGRVMVPVADSTEDIEFPTYDTLDTSEFNNYSRNYGKTNFMLDQLPVDRDLGYFLGLMVGDGWASIAPTGKPRGVNLATTYPEMQEEFKRLVDRLMQVEMLYTVHTSDEGKLGDNSTSRIQTTSMALSSFVYKCIGRKSCNKHLPSFTFTAPREFKLGLLAGLWDSDGSLSWSNGKSKPQFMCNYSSQSLRLVQEIQSLLKSLGVNSSITRYKSSLRKKDHWMLSVSTPNLYDLGGFDVTLSYKRKLMDEFLAGEKPNTANTSSRHNLVPAPHLLFSYLQKCLNHKEYPSLYAIASKAKKNGHMPISSAKTLLDAVDQDKFSMAPEDVQELYETWKTLLDNKYHFEEVKSVEKTGTYETGYDLSVPGSETFMSLDGVVLSNTMRVHVPSTPEASKEALEKMLPSRNLINAKTFEPLSNIKNEFILGLHLASAGGTPEGKPKVFETAKDAIMAYRRGEIGVSDAISIIEDSRDS